MNSTLQIYSIGKRFRQPQLAGAVGDLRPQQDRLLYVKDR